MACSFLSSICKALSLSFFHQLNKHHGKTTAGPWNCVPSGLEAVKRRQPARSPSAPCTSPAPGENCTQGPGVTKGNAGRQTPRHLENGWCHLKGSEVPITRIEAFKGLEK